WKGKKGSFPKQLRPDYTLNSLGKMSESVAAQPDLAASLPFWNSKDKSKELRVHQQPPYPTTLVEDPPNLSNRRAIQAHGAVSILPRQFPLSDELRKKLEHHLRKRLIQHRWGLPRRIHESLSLMRPPKNFSNIPEMGHYRRLQQTSKSQSSNTLNVGLSPPESFHEGDSEMLQLEDPFGKDLGNNPENGPKEHLLSDPESSSDKDMGYDAEEELMSPSENTSRASVERLGQRQLENVLRIHLSKKLEEINEGQLPGTVHSSWHTMNQTLLHPEKSHTEIQQRVLPPSVGGEYCLNTSRELSFIESNAQQMLESHIKQFHHRM
ncbi:spermatogenesis-associated protein 31D4-like, partial [Puma concolor]|uniref:Spermatogenesis-associated protein 31D4-like n=1 Tax=Puma concolor TaxID=9696 RepID=A0A6P6I4M9_PUMCO